MRPRAALLVAAVVLAAGSAVLLLQRRALQNDLAAMAEAGDSVRAGRADAALAAEVDRIRLALERARSQPLATATPHLALSLGDSLLTLERGEVVLRSARVTADVPRGIRVIAAVEPGRIVLEHGIIVTPADADTGAVPAGTIRVSRADFAAIQPNLRAGLVAFLF